MSSSDPRRASRRGRVTWALLSAEFQLQAGRHAEFAEPFAALYRDHRNAIAGLVKLLAQKAGVPVPANADEIATCLIAVTHGIALQRAADPRSVPAAAAGRAVETLLCAIFGPKLLPGQ